MSVLSHIAWLCASVYIKLITYGSYSVHDMIEL